MPKTIKNIQQSVGPSYPKGAERLKHVGDSQEEAKRIALIGDSTIDNSFWVSHSTQTVTHQVAMELANSDNSKNYTIANFSVDGAVTSDVGDDCLLNKVLGKKDTTCHPPAAVNQLHAVDRWQPEIVVLSVGGNNYREALVEELAKEFFGPLGIESAQTILQMLFQFQWSMLFRITPAASKEKIKQAFNGVKETLLLEYKGIIDILVAQNQSLKRIVLVSQYYPALSNFGPYFIYSGFSHLAHAEGLGQSPFQLMEETLNGLYRDVLAYASDKCQDIVFADITSSLNPLGGYHTSQIEPNTQGSQIMGKMIAAAIEHPAPSDNIAVLKLAADEKTIKTQVLQKNTIKQNLKVKGVGQYIKENRYRHVGLLFSPSTNLVNRYSSAYDVIMGKQFDTEYMGLFAFGLLDISIVTLIASYLWRVALHENVPWVLRLLVGGIVAPILLLKMIVGLCLLILFAWPIYKYHQRVYKEQNISTEALIESSQEISDFVRKDCADMIYHMTHGRTPDLKKAQHFLTTAMDTDEQRANVISKKAHGLRDKAGRLFETPMSVYGYAFWSGDMSACEMMDAYFMDNDAAREQVLAECQMIAENGVNFRLKNNLIEQSKSFDFQPLIQAYMDANNAPTTFDQVIEDHHLLLNLSKAQAMLPLNVMQECYMYSAYHQSETQIYGLNYTQLDQNKACMVVFSSTMTQACGFKDFRYQATLQDNFKRIQTVSGQKAGQRREKLEKLQKCATHNKVTEMRNA